MNAQQSPQPVAPNTGAIIKCGNCGFEGSGEKARRTIFTVLAWICVLFAPLVTIIYFLATSKYRCPKCKSTFLGIRGSDGVYHGQRGGNAAVVIIIVIVAAIAVIGILSSVVLASLNSARMKGRDARRVADIKQLQVALELHFFDNDRYPTELASLQPDIMNAVPTDPAGGTYTYTYCSDTEYHLGASLENPHVELDDDADVSGLCAADTINGTDDGKCSPADLGNHCYDVIAPTE